MAGETHDAAAPGATTPVTRRELGSFGLTVGGACGALALFALWRGRPLVSGSLGVAGLVLIAGGLLAPSRLALAYRVWMTFALALSRVTTPIFMGVVYFAVLTPIGLALRLVGRRPLRAPRRGTSAWVRRDDRRSDMRRQF